MHKERKDRSPKSIITIKDIQREHRDEEHEKDRHHPRRSIEEPIDMLGHEKGRK